MTRQNKETHLRSWADVVCKIWLNPTEQSEIGNANSRAHIKKLTKEGDIIVKPTTVHSRARTRALPAAKRKGRHWHADTGTNKVCMPTKRVLRRLLRKYREAGKINKHLYVAHFSFPSEVEKSCTRVLTDQMEARRVKNKVHRRTARVQEKRTGFLAIEVSSVKE
ncbi:ribosomal protein L19/L19e domain-containing protein [Mycena maculata]|uniref:Ribosomal protein L19/L19e domain-containing protein n=1 Tax=Mycena maculata TaxID=230809 RepID=A0AAD7MWX1_9AGAR|nr:ribosomal protein L19/L19e domain-containing protein [Mycena maculata]